MPSDRRNRPLVVPRSLRSGAERVIGWVAGSALVQAYILLCTLSLWPCAWSLWIQKISVTAIKRFLRTVSRRTVGVSAWIALGFLAKTGLVAQTPGRITAEISNADRTTIPNSHPPMARADNDRGRLASGTLIHGMSIVMLLTSAQEAALQELIASQQNSSSAQYHKWLTPDQFASRFGLADTDIAKVQSWLEQQGFAVESVARSKNRITFSGTAGQVESAFGTELHNYTVAGETHYAPSSDVSIPAALSSVVQTVGNLSSFRPRAHVQFKSPQRSVSANFTSSQSGNHYLTPKDVATIYDINAAYNAGYTGTGQQIAIVGQSSVSLSDIEAFQSAAGLATKDPTVVLVPSSGTSAVSSGDEAESDLDLEYSGAIAKGADIYFVYVGNDSNYSTFDAIQYAVDTRIAPIISNSYGDCETDLSTTDYSSLNGVLEQAASQGQSVISAAGDDGSTDCYEDTSLTTSQRTALAVDFPASSQYVTGMGGTEFPSSDTSSSNTTYWSSASGSDVISSALSYIPEQVWNDDSSSNGLSSGGGGVSTLTSRPSWQTGVTGIPSGSYRLVPDNAGYLYCSSDSNATGITGSCSDGFRDSSDEYLTVAGGTSFAAPIFSGMLAIINQKLNSTGQGVINSTLYSLAASSTTYASAFHDITSGSNECTAGSSYCESAGESEYPATTGYDEASGLGSVDLDKLLTAWPTTSASSLTASTTTLTAASSSPASGASDAITITVASSSTSLTTTPTGTLTITVDGTEETSSLALSNGSASYSFSSTTAGSHVIEATYSGDTTYAGSTGSAVVAVGSSTSSSSGSFTLAATNLTVSAGSSGTSTITITPKNGYTGTIGWSVSTDSSLSNACYSLSDATVSGTSAVTATMTIDTSSSACSSTSISGGGGKRKIGRSTSTVSSNRQQTAFPLNAPRAGVAMVGLLFFGLFGCRSRRSLIRMFALACLVTMIGLTFGCGSSSSSSASASSSSNASKGTYTLTITGTDTSSSITASTSMTLTID
jgi:subtilase family serine protease